MKQGAKMGKSKIYSFSATDEAMGMLLAVSKYHQLTKSAAITALIKKEFWRIFPQGTGDIKPIEGARIQKKIPLQKRKRESKS